MADRRWSRVAGCLAVALVGIARTTRAADNLTFVSLPPCRVIDTRVPGTPLVAGAPRSFVFRGPTLNYQNPAPFPNQGGSTTGCGIPDLTKDGANQRNVAKAVAINIIAVGPAGDGDLRAWPANQSAPLASVINYAAVPGLNLANGVIVPLCDELSAAPCAGGDITFRADVSDTHLVVDVVGYFETEAATLFSRFGGDGHDGALHVTSNLTQSAARREYTSLTVDASTTLTMARPFTFVGVQGTCSIAGTVSVNGKGASGGAGAVGTTIGFDGSPGMDGTLGNASALQLLGCAAGAGGGGGFAGSQKGGTGGGAGGPGGTAFAGTGGTLDFNGLTAGASGHGNGDLRTPGFPALLTCAGGGGGGGGAELGGLTGGSGGAGGGVLYLECGALDCTGALTARGAAGAAGSETNGGGGGGGVILVRTRRLISEACLPAIDVSGGTGGGLGGGGFFDVVVVP